MEEKEQWREKTNLVIAKNLMEQVAELFDRLQASVKPGLGSELEHRCDQERDRQNNFRGNWPDPAEDEGNRPEDLRRHCGNAGGRGQDRITKLWRVRSQKAGCS